MHDFNYWVLLAWLTPKSSFGWPVADTKGTPSWTMVELFAHYTSRRHLSLYFGFTNVHYIQIHITIHIISYIAFEIYITQADAISVFNPTLPLLPPPWQLYHNINCTNPMQMHFIYVYGELHHIKWGDKTVEYWPVILWHGWLVSLGGVTFWPPSAIKRHAVMLLMICLFKVKLASGTYWDDGVN